MAAAPPTARRSTPTIASAFRRRPAYTLRRVWLSEEEQDGYYYGFANEGLWPLCHIAFVRPTFRETDWEHYAQSTSASPTPSWRKPSRTIPSSWFRTITSRFSRAWCERLPKATIITFWHIPWPNAETFGICPWKEEIIDGLLGSSILGFHTQFHCNNFFETVDRFVESRIDREHASVTSRGMETLIRPYPISIDWPPAALAAQKPVAECRAAVRERFGLPPEAVLLVGIERFDYTKGILDRMRAMDDLLSATRTGRAGSSSFRSPRRRAASSRPTASCKKRATRLADEINARHGNGDYKPIVLVVRHQAGRSVRAVPRRRRLHRLEPA